MSNVNRVDSSSSSLSLSATDTPQVSYVVVTPIPADQNLEVRIKSVVTNCIYLIHSFHGSKLRRDFSIIFGINATRVEYAKVLEKVTCLTHSIQEKYFDTPLSVQVIHYPWDPKHEEVNYAEIRNTIWYSSEMKKTISQLVGVGRSSEMIRAVKILALDPDTQITPVWLAASDLSRSVLTAGYYNFVSKNPLPFVDPKTLTLNWNDVVAEVGNIFDLAGKQEIGNTTFLNYKLLGDRISAFSDPNAFSELLANDDEFVGLTESLNTNFQLMHSLRYQSLEKLLACCDDILRVLDGIELPLDKKELTLLKQSLPRLFKAYEAEERIVQNVLSPLQKKISGKRILYPSEALMCFSVWDKETNVDRRFALLTGPQDKRLGKIWGRSGSSEGQAVIEFLQARNFSPEECIDFVDVPYDSGMPGRVYEIPKRFLVQLPWSLDGLRASYLPRRGFDFAFLDFLSRQSFQKNQSCLQHPFFIEQRRKFILQMPYSQETRFALIRQFEAKINEVFLKSKSKARKIFSDRMLVAMHSQNALAGLTLSKDDLATVKTFDSVKSTFGNDPSASKIAGITMEYLE